MKLLEFIGFRILVAIFSIIPFWSLYIYSDFLYFLFYYVFGYRKNVVIANLKMSFPDQTEDEINNICKKFYKHLSDITLESVKSMSIREKALKKRYVIKGQELANKYFAENKSILCLTSHYGNWEYGILGTNNSIHHQAIALYLPLTNKYSERYGLKRRKRFGMKMVAVQETKSIFNPPPVLPVAIIMAADQSPSNLERAIWINFLGIETACLHGPEAYAKKTGMPVMYLKISKLKRGYYSLEIEELLNNPKKCEPNQITNVYFKRLEQDINEQPEYWLWSHRRWKHKINK
ncbi:MAG: lysophospholipid acyltransferase family protein [Bacteroidales bacterium]|jgi:KDO2-lipid IV(A) lauroyltransferase|nr:lysophospholipid acyltransferase family protein [Bacteroidales bacterium]MDD4217387.1 lysophospholipid acyltransferase family protein [Bacteroidales bacterium]MDY0141098.1 lysophospholipid acyltransferase family protein [Bacteroidales bacterium]